MNQVWIVQHPDHDTVLTVIAQSEEEARRLAGDFEDESWVWYEARVDSDPRRRRWVQFESQEEASEMVQETQAAGVLLPDTLIRVTYLGAIEADHGQLWEVGLHDQDWCRLSSGVLCGGGE